MYGKSGINVFEFYPNGSVYFIGNNELELILHCSKNLKLYSENYVFNNIKSKGIFSVLTNRQIYILLKYSTDFDQSALTFRAT